MLLAALLAATVVDFLPTGQKAAQAATEDPAPAPAPAAAGPAERPDFVSAQLTARAEKRRIEVTGERTETTSTFVNPDGTVTVDSYSGIRRVRRGEDWVDVDSTLVLADGKVTPKVTKAGVELSAGGSKAGDVATLVDGDREIAFGWPGALPAPELKDNTATYKGVAKDTDLVVKVFPTGYDVQIVAHTPAAAQAALSLPMRLKGVTATRTPGGELRMSAGGKVTARSPVPLMWDSHVNATSKLPDRVRDVAATLDTAKADRPTLALKPDKGWLTDPARQYPVTIDPAATLADNLDTDVNNVYTTTNYDTYEYLRVGNYAGAAVNRSFLRFDDSAIKGKHVTSAVLNLWQAGSATCTTQPTTVQGAGGMGAGTTWATQPSADGITWGSATFNNGGSCTSSGGTNIDITGLVDAWAHNGYPSPETLTLRAPNESDANQFKYFYSGDTFLAPNISTTYNSYPGTVAGRFTKPCSAQCGGTPAMVLTNTTTPTLSGASLDPEGSPVRLDFEVWNSAGTTMVTSGSVTNVTSNSVGSWTVPSGLLTNGTAYQWRSRAYDGVDYSQAWSGWIPFTVDTTAPAAPTGLSSAAWASGGWGTATSGTFSWTSPGGDTQSFLYGLDQPSPATETTATTTPTLSPGGGLHTLYLRTKDKSGNLSSVVSYGFGVGAGALAQPAEGVRVQRYATLEGQAPAAQTKVTFQYRMGTNTATAWSDVPTADVTIAGTSTHPTWPMNRNGSGLFDKLTWDLNTTLTGFGAPDGPVQIQACFRDAANTVSCAPLHTVQFARRAFADADATQPVGPGTVALLTGDYSVSATDVSMPTYTGDLTVGRSFTTLAVGGTVGVFGPGWTASMPGPDAGSADRTLTDYTATDGYAALTDENGVQDIYVRTGSGTYPYTYIGVGDVATDGSKLVKDSATQFTLTEVDGTRTIYAAQTVGGATVWRVSQVIEPGTNTTSTFTTDSSGRTTRILAPVPAGVTCTTLVAGCRALTIGYAASTTATGTGTDPATWGDYTGRLTSVAMSLNGDAPVNVAAYAYDSAGKLRSAKDPRTGLTTTYAYDAAGRLAQITPPGQATWTLTYDGAARLYTASRPAPGGGTATQTVVYDVAVTGTGAPIDLAPAQVANWAQTDIPLYGAAVFPAGHVPAAVPAAADWPYADLTYLNADGKQVNSASYGNGAWQISTTEHDSKGNTIRSLSAENRNQALTPTADTDMTVAALTSSAARSQLLDEQTVYSSDGVTVTDTYGPTHQIVDNAGARYSARQHEHTDYDQGAPSSTDPYRLATTITTSTRLANGTDVDSRKTVNGYEAKTGADPSTSGWALRKPTTVATWMGGGSTPDIVRTTYYNAAGNTVESRQPKANAAGTDAFTTVTTYYTATGSGSCVNASRTGLACTSGPAAQPSSGNPLPVSTYTYNSLNQVLTEVETVNSTTRTTTYVYDTAGRKTSEAVVASPAADGGTTIPTATYGYDPASGQATTTTASGITLTTGYDSWGRVTSQTDADGNTSTTGYDIDSQVTSSTDGKGIYTYTYDGANEHRGLVTSLNVGAGSAPSTFTAAYNADGKLTSQTYPNGLVATTRYDNNAEPTSLTYAKSGTPWLAFTQANSIHEQVRLDTSPVSAKNLGYDLSGRLTSVADTVGYGGPASCTTRAYTYDPDSNRTALTSYPDAGGSETGTCSTSTTPTGYGFTYDQADRLTNSGFAYDLFGRTTTDPYPPAGSSATIGYYVNDLVASETVAGTTRTYALDPARRLRSWTVGATTTTNHYTSASGDSAAWIGSGATWTRNITGIGGDLAATQTDTGAVTLQLANLHGDIIATVDDTTTASSITSYSESTEFGVPYFSSAAYARYGWLGAKQRSRDTLSGLTLMGVRLYDPNLGRFLSTDPVPGGSDNPYDYAHQDPYNTLDLDGRMFGWAKKAAKKAWKYRRQITGGLALAACFGGPLLCAGAQTLAFVTRASYRIQHQGFRRSLRANVGDAIFSTMNYGGVWLPLKKAGSAVRFDRKYTKLILKAGGGLSGGANFAGGFSRRRNRSYYAP